MLYLGNNVFKKNFKEIVLKRYVKNFYKYIKCLPKNKKKTKKLSRTHIHTRVCIHNTQLITEKLE